MDVRLIKGLNKFFNNVIANRQKKFDEFYSFAKFLIQELDPKLAATVSFKASEVSNGTSGSFLLNAADLAWWSLEHKSNPNLVMKDIAEIKQVILKRFFNDLANSKAITKADNKMLIELFEELA